LSDLLSLQVILRESFRKQPSHSPAKRLRPQRVLSVVGQTTRCVR
jgi:hypothetical protein